jgi:hypothetical protein
MGFREVSLTPGVAVNRRFLVDMRHNLTVCRKATRIAPRGLPDAGTEAAIERGAVTQKPPSANSITKNLFPSHEI